MGKLNQIIAVSQGKKSQAERAITNCYQMLQKGNLLEGISRSYQPLDEEGEKLPPESKNVQMTVAEAITQVAQPLADWFNCAATQEWANTEARADIVLSDGTTTLSAVPVSVLLFLEKRMVDMNTFVSKLPTLDPAENWEYDEASDAYRTRPAQTVRNKKMPRNHVLAQATDKHPAQVQMYTEDIQVGTWTTVKFSGAIPAKTKNNMLNRVRELQEAIKKAREEANSINIAEQNVADKILDYIFKRT